MADRRPRRGGGGGDATAGPGLDPERCVYGRHPVREAARGRRGVRVVHATQHALDDLDDVIGRSFARLGARSASSLIIMRCACSPEATIIKASLPRSTASRMYRSTSMLARARKLEQPPLILCLDQVTDPHNLGAIARVADAAGATGVLLPEHRSARVTAAAVKASAGALEHVLVARCTNLANEIDRIKGASIWAYAATERGTRDWTDVDLADGALLVLGAEGPGIRPRVLASCDEQVCIPMAGEVASLNVATVAAVLAFEAVRQRRAAAR